MNLEKYFQPWVFALIGGLLILGATSLSGVIEYRRQLELEGVRNNITNLSDDIESARFYYLQATLKSDLGYIQQAVDKIKRQNL